MHKIPLLFTLCLSLCALPVQASEAEKKAAVVKLFEVMGIDRQMSGGFEAMLPTIESKASKFNLSPSAKRELIDIYRDWYNNDLDRAHIKAQLVDSYTQAFTKNEIEEAIRFYQTPLGKKLSEIGPELMKRSAKIGMIEARSKQAMLMRRLQPFFLKQIKK